MSTADGITINTSILDEAANVMLISISGYIDQANCHEMQETIDRCLSDQCYNLVFDLQNLVYMSSAGWGVLIGEIKRFRENGGDIKLCNMGPEIYEIYQMLEFYHIISEYPSPEEALKAFRKDHTHVEEISVVIPELDEDDPEADEEPAPTTKGDGVQNAGKSAQKKPAPDGEPRQEADAPHNEQPHREPSHVVLEEEVSVNIDEIFGDHDAAPGPIPREKPENYVEFDPGKYERQIDVKVMPVPDKIRTIIGRYPELSPRQIRKMLRHPEFGGVKIGWLKMRSMLKLLELDTKEKRFRYFRSA